MFAAAGGSAPASTPSSCSPLPGRAGYQRRWQSRSMGEGSARPLRCAGGTATRPLQPPPSAAFTAGDALPGLALRAAGIAAGEAIVPARREEAAEKRLSPVFGWLPTISKSPQLPVLLLGLLAISIALLSLASVEPGHTLRFRTMRVIARHQVQIAWLGGALLISAILLFLLQ